MKVTTTVGPFHRDVTHIHDIKHINGHPKNLTPHPHPVSIMLDFRAINPDQPSLLVIGKTQNALEEKLSDFFNARVFSKPFEQVTTELGQSINRWIPELCDRFKLSRNFYLSSIHVDVQSHADELHHAEGTTTYRVDFEESDVPHIHGHHTLGNRALAA